MLTGMKKDEAMPSFSSFFILFITKAETIQRSLLLCFDLGAEEGRHRLHARLVHLCQTFLGGAHLLGRLE